MITLSFVVPLFNEEERVQKTISALLSSQFQRPLKLEKVIFVNDGSTDSTTFILARKKAQIQRKLNAKVVIINFPRNYGKGHAIRMGMQASNSDYTVFFDADISTPLSELQKFVPHMKNGVEVIIGTRKNGKATVIKYQPLYRQVLGKGFTSLSNFVLQTNVTDHTCGFKGFSKAAKDMLFSKASINGWAYDSELIYLSTRHGFSMQEVPVLWANDDNSRVNLSRDILSSLYELVSIRANDFMGRYATVPGIQPVSSLCPLSLE